MEPGDEGVSPPSNEQIRKLLVSLTPTELFSVFIRFALVPEHPQRQAYTILRHIYLPRIDRVWDLLNDGARQGFDKVWGAQIKAAIESASEAESWLRPPERVLTLEAALNMIEGTKSQLWRNAVMKGVGKHRRRGQPASKRWLAVWALDFKCDNPDLSLSEVTEEICQCGKDKHTEKCREQLRQQIKGLVKFLDQHGYDFTWDHIRNNRGWKELL